MKRSNRIFVRPCFHIDLVTPGRREGLVVERTPNSCQGLQYFFVLHARNQRLENGMPIIRAHSDIGHTPVADSDPL